MEKAKGPTRLDEGTHVGRLTGLQPEEDIGTRQLLDAYLENSPLAVIEFDRAFRIIRWAGSATRMYGYSAEEMLGKSMADIAWVSAEEYEEARRRMEDLFEGDESRTTSTSRRYRADGSIIWCECYSSVTKDPEGRAVSVLSLILDVTERKRAEEAERQELERTRILLDTAEVLASGRSLGEVLDRVCDAVLRAFAHRRVILNLWDEDRQRIVAAASKGEGAVPVGESARLSEMTAAGRRVLEERAAAVVDYDIEARVGPAHMPSHLALVVPLLYADRLVGLLTVDDPTSRREFTPRELELAEGIGSQASIAIENARLYEDERERARLGQALSLVDLAVHSSLEWQEIAERSLRQVASVLAADTGAIAVHHDSEWVIAESHGFRPSLEGARFAEDAGLRELSEMVRRETLAFDDTAEDARVSAIVRPFGVKSLVAAPLVVRDEMVAGLLLTYQARPHHFTSAEVQFVSQVASALSLSFENSRLYAAQKDVSNRLQEAMLTLPERVEGIEFAHAYHSASEAARVGGDFYDLFEVGDGFIGLTIGDVSGKGLEAAVLTSLAKNTIRAHAVERGKSPGEILALANEVLVKATPSHMFVTVFFGLLDRLSGALLYASAGHTTGVIARGNARMTALPPTGPLLGAIAGASFSTAEEHVTCDDLIFLYTDGLTEARGEAGFYGEARLFELLDRMDLQPLDVVHTIVEDVLAFSGLELRDDLAMLAVRPLPPERETPAVQKPEP